MSSYTDVFSGKFRISSADSYNHIDLNQDIVLVWPSQQQDGTNTLTSILEVTPTQNGFTLTLPDAKLVSPGYEFVLNNLANFSFDVVANDGQTVIQNVLANQFLYFYLYDNTTSNGGWRISPFGLGAGTPVTSVAATAPNRGIIIQGSPITTVGTLLFTLSNMLAALETLGENAGNGFITQNGDGNLNLRSINAGNLNINVTNPDGSGGNTVITLNSNLTGLVSAVIGNVQLQGDAITNSQNNDLQFGNNVQMVGGRLIKFLNTNGNFYTALSGPLAATQDLNFVLPSNVGGNNAIMQTSNTGVLSFSDLTTVIADKITMETPVSPINPVAPVTMFHHPGVSKAVCVFNGNTSAINYNYNIATVSKISVGQYLVTFINNFSSTNYVGVASACTVSASAPTVANLPRAEVIVRDSGSAIICVVVNGSYADSPLVSVCFYGALQ